VVVKGGNKEELQDWLKDLNEQDSCWHGQLQGEPQAFLAALGAMDAQLISLHRSRVSLEEFFIRQLRERGITFSQ